MTDQNKGPWGNPESDDGGREEPKRGSPWQPSRPGGAEEPAGARRGPSLEEMIRRGKGPFGPQLPQLPGGRSLWAYALLALAALWLVLTSFHSLESHEEGVVSTLGSYSHTVGPGISMTLPYPLQTMEKVPSRRAQTENIPDGTGQNLVLTADANIINVTYSVRWVVSDPELFLFQIDDPRRTIRDAAESAMRATIANFRMETAITSGKADIEEQVRVQLQRILNGYRAGVRIEGVAVGQVEAPTEVAEAFERVNVARQQSQTYLNEARTYASRVVQTAEGEAQAFNALYEQYRQSPQVTRRRIYYETMEQVLRRAEKTVVDPRGVTSVLPLPPAQRTVQPPAPGNTAGQTRRAAPANGGTRP